MEDDLPTLRRVLPNCRAPRFPLIWLEQSIGQKVHVPSEPPTMKIRGFPFIDALVPATFFQTVQDVFSAITTTRCADLPKVRRHHVLEIGSCHPKFWPMQDWLTADQLLENIRDLGIGNQRIYP